MKWFRRITKASYQEKDPQYSEPKTIRVYVSGEACGWGELTDFNVKGDGYIKFDKGSGQLIRNWDHFLSMVEIIETE